ncbi:MAG: MotA/TolQ/ExbB proton channel family protein [Alphaproteobacteria bacterium]|nr:MotA/TolQ/ExbB proton channel family protein [Alphaproteobacteria bacterium]
MNDEAPAQAATTAGAGATRLAAAIKVSRPRKRFDIATGAGLVLSIILITAALLLTGNLKSFYDLPSVLMVVLGTFTITAVSFSSDDLKKGIQIIRSSLVKSVRRPSTMARQLLDIAVLVKSKGPLSLSQIEAETKKDPFLFQAINFIADGYNADEISRILTQDIEALIDRHKRTASIARRAAEVAPAMGLVGTLVGLVQMLNQLDDPSTIGPSMAIALLTTFYGAIMSTVFLMPLANKLERNSTEDVMIKDMILAAVVSMARQDHPRKLEHELNMLLPPGERIRYFSQ